MSAFIYELGELAFGAAVLYGIFAINCLFWSWYRPIRAKRKGHTSYLRKNLKFETIIGSRKKFQYDNGAYGDFYIWEERVLGKCEKCGRS